MRELRDRRVYVRELELQEGVREGSWRDRRVYVKGLEGQEGVSEGARGTGGCM